MTEPSPTTATPSRAEALFADWIGARASGEPRDLETLCRAHPELRVDLERMYAGWMRVAQVLDVLDPREMLGSSLHAAGSSSVAAGSTASSQPALKEFLGALAARDASFGQYRIDGEVGRGGMGLVLRVWDRDLRRPLAMKVILDERRGAVREASRAGESAERIAPIDALKLARFIEEAQVTGQLDHPGIVPVHALGLDPGGQAYFTMKLVKGRTFKDVLDDVSEHKDGWTEARALTVIHKVCEAMAYAHDKGVVHRDLKPGNIMVGEFGEVYVMDWGLARILGRADRHDIRLREDASEHDVALGSEREALRRGASDSPLYTLDGDIIGTPAYMPPEQAAGKVDEIGPHSDVYAVGAMLYHLLAGHMPYVPRDARLDNQALWARVRAHPPAPLHEVAPRAPADLAAICDKAMARDHGQRYRDMSELALDLTAYLEGRVVKAHEAGAWAEGRKWVLRNRALAGALMAVALTLVVGLLVSLALKAESDASSVRAEKNAALAEHSAALAEKNASLANDERVKAVSNAKRAAVERDKAESVAGFLGETLKGVTPSVAVGRDTTMLREMMDAAAARIEKGELSAAPEAKVSLMLVIGDTYFAISQWDKAERVLRPALAEARSLYTADDPVLEELCSVLAEVLHARGDLDAAEPLMRETLEMNQRLHPEGHPHTAAALISLSSLLIDRRDLDGAERLCRQALSMSRALHAGDHRLVAEALIDLGTLLMRKGDLVQAESLLTESLAMRQRLFDGDHPDIAAGLRELAAAIARRGDAAGAEPLLRRSLAMQRRLSPGDDPAVALNIEDLAGVLDVRRDLAGAEVLYREALEMLRRLHHSAGDHKDVLSCLTHLTSVLTERGDLAGAATLAEEASAMSKRLYPNDDFKVADRLDVEGGLARQQGDLARSEALYRDALEMKKRLYASAGGDHSEVASTLNNLAAVLKDRGDLGQAETLLREALAMAQRLHQDDGGDHPEIAIGLTNLGVLLKRRGDLDNAELYCRQALEMQQRLVSGDHQGIAMNLGTLSSIRQARGDLAGAETLQREALEMNRRLFPGNQPAVAASLRSLASVLQARGDFAGAETQYLESLRMLRAALPETHPSIALVELGLGTVLTSEKRFTEAHEMLVAAENSLSQSKAPPAGARQKCLQALIDLETSWDVAEPDQGHARAAAEWKQKLGGLEPK